MPGRCDIPLSCATRDNENRLLVEDPGKDFISNLINMAPLNGTACETDAAEVHTCLVKFIEGNATAEAKMRSHNNQGNSRSDFIALRDHYEGAGFHAVAITKAEETISTSYYSGEKFQMNWEKFERELNLAWATIDKKEGRAVYSDERKIRISFTKVRSADFLKTMCSTLESQILNPMHGITCEHCMTAFRNEVRKKFPPEATSSTRSRRVQEVGRGRGRGRGIRGSRNGANNNTKRSHPEERMVKGKSGKWLAVHASYQLPREIWIDLPDAEVTRINNERAEYKKRKMSGNDNETVISQIATETNGMATIQVPMTMLQQASTQATNVTNSSSGNQNPMGGRHEQAQLRSRNNSQL